MSTSERRTRVEWLRALEADPAQLHRLCAQVGLARAAWQIAEARRGAAPDRITLRAVARELSVRVSWFDAFPDVSRLEAECARWGLALAA